MKAITLLFAVLLFASPAAHATKKKKTAKRRPSGELVLSCAKAERLVQDDERHEGDGAPRFTAADLLVKISAGGEGTNGYTAEVTSRGNHRRILDVTVKLEEPGEEARVKEIAAALDPGFDYAKVSKVRAANVGLRANERGHGIFVYELLGADDHALLKIATEAFHFYRCLE